jgi:hypothetical protein
VLRLYFFWQLFLTGSDPDKFVKADPFPFLLTALIVFVYGPGRFSVDALLNWGSKKLAEKRRPASASHSVPY